MIVYEPHQKALRAALETEESILVLPPLHPDYLQALLAWWLREQPGRTVRLIESGLGASKVLDSGALAAPAAGGRSYVDWLHD